MKKYNLKYLVIVGKQDEAMLSGFISAMKSQIANQIKGAEEFYPGEVIDVRSLIIHPNYSGAQTDKLVMDDQENYDGFVKVFLNPSNSIMMWVTCTGFSMITGQEVIYVYDPDIKNATMPANVRSLHLADNESLVNGILNLCSTGYLRKIEDAMGTPAD